MKCSDDIEIVKQTLKSILQRMVGLNEIDGGD